MLYVRKLIVTYAKCRHAECFYAECRYTECRGSKGTAAAAVHSTPTVAVNRSCKHLNSAPFKCFRPNLINFFALPCDKLVRLAIENISTGIIFTRKA